MLIARVVGQFNFLKGDLLLHPLWTGQWRLWMDVKTDGWYRLSFSSDDPIEMVELVAVVVGGCDVE